MGIAAIFLFAAALFSIILCYFVFRSNVNWQEENRQEIIEFKAKFGHDKTLNFKGYNKLMLILQLIFYACLFFGLVCLGLWFF